jgi:hypothetical protein
MQQRDACISAVNPAGRLAGRSDSGYNRIFLAVYAVLIFNEVLATSNLNKLFWWDRYYTGTLLLALAVLGISFLWKAKLQSMELMILLAILLICALTAGYSGRIKYTLGFFLVVFFGMKIAHEKICSTYVIASACGIVLVLILWRMGILGSDFNTRTGGATIRYYFGFTYTTILPNLFFFLVLGWFFVKRHKIGWISTVAVLGINYILYRYTDTKAVYLELILLMVMLWAAKLIDEKQRWISRLIRFFTVWTMPVLTGLIFFLACGYSEQKPLFVLLNNRLSDRLRLSHMAIEQYGFHLWGTETHWATGRFGIERFTDYFYVDSSYLNIFLSYGFVMLLFIVIGFMLIGRQMADARQYSACAVLMILALHSFTDPQLFEIRYNPMLSMLGAAYFYQLKHKGMAQTEEQLL